MVLHAEMRLRNVATSGRNFGNVREATFLQPFRYGRVGRSLDAVIAPFGCKINRVSEAEFVCPA
jgi:hypothetical protein